MEYLRSRNLARRFRHLLSAPFIYSVVVPTVFFDIILEVYHRICFPLYRISYVHRREYIRIDRQKLAYLTPLQKLNCMYCGYVNGWLKYATEIAARTEQYWCGIMHKQGGNFHPPEHHQDFLPYGDEEAYREYVGKK